jgi:hypothetical protein
MQAMMITGIPSSACSQCKRHGDIVTNKAPEYKKRKSSVKGFSYRQASSFPVYLEVAHRINRCVSLKPAQWRKVNGDQSSNVRLKMSSYI